MRLKKNRLHQYYHRIAISKKDNEGNAYLEYGEPVPFMAETWAGGGKVQLEMYGKRLPNIRNIRMEGNYVESASLNGSVIYTLGEGLKFTVDDGICIFTEPYAKPDYKVVAIYPYTHLMLELERM